MENNIFRKKYSDGIESIADYNEYKQMKSNFERLFERHFNELTKEEEETMHIMGELMYEYELNNSMTESSSWN